MQGINRFIIKRLILLVPTVLIVLTVIFFALNVLPGDAAKIYVGLELVSPEGLTMVRQRMGLDVPIHVRYFRWIWGVLHGDLGQSLITGQPVQLILAQRLPITLTVTAITLVFSICVAIPLGVVAALKRNTKFDFLASSAILVGSSMPTFWLGIILIIIFSVSLGLLPSAGFDTTLFYNNPLRALGYLVLPSLTLSGWCAANLTRIVRSSMLEIMMQDYIITARAKGLTERIVIFKHALRNSLIPMVTVLGLQMASLLGGAVATETIFSIAGIGTLVLASVYNRDYTVLQGTLLVVAVLLVLLNLVIDVAYAYVDPRIRLR